MDIVCFPSDIDPDGKLYVDEKLEKYKRDYLTYILQFIDAERKLRRDINREQFDIYVRTEHITYIDGELWEFRFPKQSKRGVLRVYFAFSTIKNDKIILFDCEVKTKKQSNTKTAIKRLRIYRKWKKEVKNHEGKKPKGSI
jgi:hypothetical protein